MEHHIGIDVSPQLSSLRVLDAAGKVVREAKVASEPEALVAVLRKLGLILTRPCGSRSISLMDGTNRGVIPAPVRHLVLSFDPVRWEHGPGSTCQEKPLGPGFPNMLLRCMRVAAGDRRCAPRLFSHQQSAAARERTECPRSQPRSD